MYNIVCLLIPVFVVSVDFHSLSQSQLDSFTSPIAVDNK